MISPELLRRYPFFSFLDDAGQKAVALVAEEVACDTGAEIFKEGQPATDLYLLMEGGVDLYFTPEANGALHERISVGEISPGEPFGLSAVVEPYVLNATASASRPCRMLRIEASTVRALCEVDCAMGYGLMREVAKAVAERLHFARLQLAATRV